MSTQYYTQKNCQVRKFNLILSSLFNLGSNIVCCFHVVSTPIEICFSSKKLEILVMREISTNV